MKKFDVLDSQLSMHQNFLLEASAGTGKTFSIQNIVVRLLLESDPLFEPMTIDQILVMTFTRASTRDLRLRIRSNIEQTLQFIDNWISQKMESPFPDYLLALLQSNDKAAFIAKKRLHQALFSFDQAQIFTIHSFCSRMLKQYAIESDVGFNSKQLETTFPTSEIMKVIKDFFRTEIRKGSYSPMQLSIILKQDPDQKKLLKVIQSGYEIIETPSLDQLYRQFIDEMKRLKLTFGLSSQALIKDFETQCDFYRNYNKESKKDTLEKIVRFAQLFDKDEWTIEDLDLLIEEGLVWVKALDPELIKKDPSNILLKHPTIYSELQKHLDAIVNAASDFPNLLSRLSKDCQSMFRKYQNEEEKLSPDDLLKQMEKALLQQPQFGVKIRLPYRAAIIDEFQDTDPTQWRIFQNLFLSQEARWKGFIYLVGDPKQSIYSFRQADIYTYLAAAKALGEKACFTLDTNYRSQPPLVKALNSVFGNVPQLIPLPKNQLFLSYLPVLAGVTNAQVQFNDDRESLHFFIADGKAFKKPSLKELESAIFFPFIANEIASLVERSNINYSQIAVLVRDRYQGASLAEYFTEHNIPFVNQRVASITRSLVLPAMVDLLRSVLHPYDRGALRTALGGSLIGLDHENFEEKDPSLHIIMNIQMLRDKLLNEGFSCFFEAFLHSHWHVNRKNVEECLLEREGGIELFHDLEQIADIIVDHQHTEWHSPEGLIKFLDRLHEWDENDDERIKRFQDPSKDGVKILTLHVSKGLEFDIVFALGLVNRSAVKDDLIPIEKEGKIFLSPLNTTKDDYKKYYAECDAEKMRQFYVATTRAKYRLYIPVALSLAQKEIKFGEASPIDLFLAKLRKESNSYEELYSRINENNGESLIHYLETDGTENHISFSIHQAIENNYLIQSQAQAVTDLIPPHTPKIIAHPILISSFTSLSNHSSLAEHPLEREMAPHDFESALKTPHTLPASNETGILLHSLLENTCFNTFRDFESLENSLFLIQPLLTETKFKEWGNPINKIIHHALKTDLKLSQKPFYLSDLSNSEMYREMEFLFPSKNNFVMEGIYFSEGFIKGVVDLIFCYNDKYYILDWKSNWLGSSVEAYKKETLHQSMTENNYFLQASIYAHALERYLKLVDKRPFQDIFGGAIYLFLRGLQPGSETGIYSFKPTPFASQ